MRKIFLFLSICFFISCQQKEKGIVIITEEKNNVDAEFVCSLQENINIVGNIKDFSFYDSTTFFVLADNNIVEYTTKGEQKNVFNKFGQGPGQYVSPTLINVYGESIYVWCAGMLKLIEYDLKGEYIREVTNYRKAIKNFKFINDDFVCFYKSDGQKDAVLDIYSIKTGEIIKSIGEVSEEDLLLQSIVSKPNMIVEQGYLYFTKPSELIIYQLDLESFSLSKKIDFEDENFVVKEIKDARSMFNTDMQGVLKYMTENSIVDNLLRLGNKFYIKSEIGKYVMNPQQNTMDSKQRFDKYYLYDFTHQDVKKIKAIKVPKKGGICKYAFYENQTYLLQEDDTDDENQERIKIFRISL